MKSWCRLVALLLSSSLVSLAHGDGISVTPDRKGVTFESFTVLLNKEQREQVERQRRVTLTIKQMAPIWAIYNNVSPSMDVLSSRYDSCTCDMGIYAIWCRPGQIEIPRHAIDSQKEKDDDERRYRDELEKNDGVPESKQYESEEFILDFEGRIYRDGKKLQESEALAVIEAMHEKRKKNEHLECYVSLDTPPPSDEATDTRVRELAGLLGAYCEKRNISFWALGISK